MLFSNNAEKMIRDAASGNPEAFRRLVEAHQQAVRGLLLRLTHFDSSRADDLAQEVFFLVFRRLSSFRFDSSFSTWLYRLAYNVFVDDQRRSAASSSSIDALREFSEPSASRVANGQDRALLRKDLEASLSRLREEERVAVILTCVEEVPHEEAAAILQIPLGTLKTHVSRGRERLKSIMITKGWEVSL